jgi:hypothetical protein
MAAENGSNRDSSEAQSGTAGPVDDLFKLVSKQPGSGTLAIEKSGSSAQDSFPAVKWRL